MIPSNPGLPVASFHRTIRGCGDRSERLIAAVQPLVAGRRYAMKQLLRGCVPLRG